MFSGEIMRTEGPSPRPHEDRRTVPLSSNMNLMVSKYVFRSQNKEKTGKISIGRKL